MALQQIESDTTEGKKVKALCAHTIQDVETCWMALTSEAEVWHAVYLKGIEDEFSLALAEAENHCSTTIREAESNGASRTHWTQQSHTKDIQCLEAEAIKEERKDCLAFLTAWGAALRASPPKGHGIMVTPYHLLLGNAPMSNLLSIPLGVSPPEWEFAPWTPLSTAPAATGPLPWCKWQHHSPDWVGTPSPSEATSKATSEDHPVPSRMRKCPSTRPCQGVPRRPLTGTPGSCERLGRSVSRWTGHTSTMRIPPIWQTSSKIWLSLLAY